MASTPQPISSPQRTWTDLPPLPNASSEFTRSMVDRLYGIDAASDGSVGGIGMPPGSLGRQLASIPRQHSLPRAAGKAQISGESTDLSRPVSGARDRGRNESVQRYSRFPDRPARVKLATRAGDAGAQREAQSEKAAGKPGRIGVTANQASISFTPAGEASRRIDSPQSGSTKPSRSEISQRMEQPGERPGGVNQPAKPALTGPVQRSVGDRTSGVSRSSDNGPGVSASDRKAGTTSDSSATQASANSGDRPQKSIDSTIRGVRQNVPQGSQAKLSEPDATGVGRGGPGASNAIQRETPGKRSSVGTPSDSPVQRSADRSLRTDSGTANTNGPDRKDVLAQTSQPDRVMADRAGSVDTPTGISLSASLQPTRPVQKSIDLLSNRELGLPGDLGIGLRNALRTGGDTPSAIQNYSLPDVMRHQTKSGSPSVTNDSRADVTRITSQRARSAGDSNQPAVQRNVSNREEKSRSHSGAANPRVSTSSSDRPATPDTALTQNRRTTHIQAVPNDAGSSAETRTGSQSATQRSKKSGANERSRSDSSQAASGLNQVDRGQTERPTASTTSGERQVERGLQSDLPLPLRRRVFSTPASLAASSHPAQQSRHEGYSKRDSNSGEFAAVFGLPAAVGNARAFADGISERHVGVGRDVNPATSGATVMGIERDNLIGAPTSRTPDAANSRTPHHSPELNRGMDSRSQEPAQRQSVVTQRTADGSSSAEVLQHSQDGRLDRRTSGRAAPVIAAGSSTERPRRQSVYQEMVTAAAASIPAQSANRPVQRTESTTQNPADSRDELTYVPGSASAGSRGAGRNGFDMSDLLVGGPAASGQIARKHASQVVQTALNEVRISTSGQSSFRPSGSDETNGGQRNGSAQQNRLHSGLANGHTAAQSNGQASGSRTALRTGGAGRNGATNRRGRSNGHSAVQRATTITQLMSDESEVDEQTSPDLSEDQLNKLIQRVEQRVLSEIERRGGRHRGGF